MGHDGPRFVPLNGIESFHGDAEGRPDTGFLQKLPLGRLQKGFAKLDYAPGQAPMVLERGLAPFDQQGLALLVA